MVLFISGISIALIVSFLCSVMEAALLSITPSKIALMMEKSPKIGMICQNFKEDIEQPIAVILILNTAAHTFGAAIAGAQFEKLYGSMYIWLFSLVFTLVMVQYTEILAKTLGVRFCYGVLRGTARTLQFLVWAMRPFIRLIHFFNRPFSGGEPDEEERAEAAVEEISALASLAREEDHISELQDEIIRNAPTLGERTIEELMLPMSQVAVLSESWDHKKVLEKIAEYKHTRYPVCRAENPMEIMGCINAKDLLFCTDDWHKVIRPINTISEDISQLDLLENIVSFDSKLLMVKDNRGRLVGMLTSHDVLMELIGKDLQPPVKNSSDQVSHLEVAPQA